MQAFGSCVKGSTPFIGTVAVADWVMRQIVVLVYVGSNPIGHLK
jgi:hypothetical protein